MIPRHQTILFIFLLFASIVMGVVLWTTLDRAHKRLLESQNTAPAQAPLVAPAEQATLMVANDADNSVTARILSLPLPQDPEALGRAVLGKLLELYAAPGSTHPLAGGASSVNEVFLVPITDAGGKTTSDGSELAVVNLAGTFTSSHPSGLETETLTILSICATLHANLPRITEVRFLVDGQTRSTLAGHAELTRTYLTAETVPTEGAHP